MRKTILTHFYNEEYLLPWWLEHHKKHFDWGVLINYGSTDRSVEIIKDICPKWKVVDSINDWFDARMCDREVIKYERQIPGWKITLNVTEFLVGDYSVLNEEQNQELKIPCSVMVDDAPDIQATYSLPLIDQKRFGIPYNEGGSALRRSRCIHNKKEVEYPLGRHYESYDNEALQVLWYGWAPYNEELKRRKLQVQTRIPESDKAQGFGREHIVTREELDKQYLQLKERAVDIFASSYV
jgi:hypothetical protein